MLDVDGGEGAAGVERMDEGWVRDGGVGTGGVVVGPSVGGDAH